MKKSTKKSSATTKRKSASLPKSSTLTGSVTREFSTNDPQFMAELDKVQKHHLNFAESWVDGTYKGVNLIQSLSYHVVQMLNNIYLGTLRQGVPNA